MTDEMTKIKLEEASLIQGNGCKKYLRRYHRSLKRGEGYAAAGNMILYADCMGLTN